MQMSEDEKKIIEDFTTNFYQAIRILYPTIAIEHHLLPVSESYRLSLRIALEQYLNAIDPVFLEEMKQMIEEMKEIIADAKSIKKTKQ